MRKDETARRSGIFEDLFAERQVYLRSGLTSRYVVLSRPLQVGVAIAMGLIVAWLAYASYSAVAQRFELAGQSRELARLEGVNKSLRAAADAAQSSEQLRDQAARVPELTSALAAAEAARERAQGLTEAATAEAEELRRELVLAEDQIRELSAEGEPGDQATDTTAETAADAGDRLAGAQAQIEELGQALDQARAENEQLARQLAEARSGAEQQAAELRDQVASADDEVARLRGDLDAALEDAAALRQSAETAAADLAQLRAEMTRLQAQVPAAGTGQDLARVKEPAIEEVARLRATLASAETRIAKLTADLEAAKRAPPAAPQPTQAGAAENEPPQAGPTAGGPTAGGPTAGGPTAAVDGQGLASVQQQLRAANQRIDELEAAIQSTVANLAPLPPPPAPR